MDIGKTIMSIGIFLVIIGAIMSFLPHAGIPRLPGDIYIKKDNFVFSFPIVTSLLISIILSVILYFFFRK